MLTCDCGGNPGNGGLDSYKRRSEFMYGRTMEEVRIYIYYF